MQISDMHLFLSQQLKEHSFFCQKIKDAISIGAWSQCFVWGFSVICLSKP